MTSVVVLAAAVVFEAELGVVVAAVDGMFLC
jgi:hypothetical protein